MWCIYIYIFVCVCVCGCVSFVLCHSVGSWVSLSSPNLISVESGNIVSGRYAYTRDLLQLDRFIDASNPPSWSLLHTQISSMLLWAAVWLSDML